MDDPIIAPGPALPTAAAFAAVTEAREYDARMHSPAETAGQHIRRMAAIAEAGLRLRDALDAGNGHRSNCPLPVADCPWCSAAAAYDAAVRAACGES